MNYVIANGAAHGEVAGKLYRITSLLPHAELGLIPVLDIPQMSDERLKELSREHPVPEGAAV